MTGFEWLSFIGGIIAAVGGKIFYKWYDRPILKIDNNIYPFTTQGEVPTLVRDVSDKVNLYCHRIKVINEGRTAAKNVRGIIEFDDGSEEKRLFWHEGYVPSITINKGDHSLLAVYGIITKGNIFTNQICIPTENGWKDLKKINLHKDLNGKIKVTAGNAELVRQEFKIPSTIPCEMQFIQ